MVRARFTGVNHYHDGERLGQGDVVELTEAQFERWRYQFVRLDEPDDDGSADAGDEPPAPAAADDAAAAGGDASPDDADDADGAAGDADDADEAAGDGAEPPAIDDLDPHPSDLTVDELRGRVRDVDEPALVRAIRDAEVETKNRSSALDAIDARLTALEE